MKQFFLSVLFMLTVFPGLYAQSTCNTAPTLTGTMSGSFNSGDQYAWYSVSSDDPLLEIVYQSQAGFTTNYGAIDLYDGPCGSLTLVQHIDSISSVDTVDLNIPVAGQNYLLRITRFDSKNAENFTVEKVIDQYWNNYFTDENGTVVTNCVSLYPVHAGEPGVPVGINGCQEIVVCLNDVLTLHLNCNNDPGTTYSCYGSTDPSTGYLYSEAFFIVSNGAVLTQLNGSVYNLSFTQLGDVQFQILPDGVSQTGNYPPNADAFTFTVHVVDAPPAGTWNNNILCASGVATLTASPGSTITSAQVDGQNIPHSNTTLQVDASNYSVGTHTVTYTLSSDCGTASYTTTFEVIEEINTTWNVDQCGNATFTFQTCSASDQSDYVLINWGDGTTEPINTLTNGSTTVTHHYAPGNYTASIVISPLVSGSSSYYSNTYPVVVYAQPITLAGSSFACEGKLQIYIVNPQTYSSVVWQVNPYFPFTGQGTTQITPSSAWASTTQDIDVSVTAVDPNGCIYVGQWLVQACCANQNQQLPADEYFEQTYYSNTNTTTGLNNKLPAGAYGGPLTVQINNPAPPNLPLITTSYTAPVTLTQLTNSYNGQPSFSWSGGVLQVTRTIYFNNDFVIDQNAVITGSDFLRFGPNARIVVNPGVTLSIIGSTLAPYCGEMWGGITMTSNNSAVSLTKVNIIGAKAGLYVYGDGSASVTSCNFIDNYEGLVMDTRSIPFTTIRDNYFGDVASVNLLPPYSSLPSTYHGMRITRCSGQTVGQNTTGTGAGNLFQLIQEGIKVENSSVYLNRNTFYQIKGASTTSLGIGVDITSGKLLPSGVTMGTTSNYFNVFYSCEVGVQDGGIVKLNSSYDLMKDVRNYGYKLGATGSITTHNIQYNKINSVLKTAYGIYLKDFGAATNLLQYNTINQNIGPVLTGGYDFSRAIYIANINATTVNSTQVLYNTINWSRTGVHVLNTYGVLVQGNTIAMDWANSRYTTTFQPLIVRSTGILVENSSKCNIFSNNISHSSLPVGIDDKNLIGIRISLSPYSYVFKNTMTRVAAGFYAYGSSWTSQVECNNMIMNNHGFYMENAEIGQQGRIWPTLVSAHNTWQANLTSDGTIGNMLYLNSSVTNYWHSPGLIFNSDPNGNIQADFWVDHTIVSFNNNCGTATNLEPVILNPVPAAMIREEKMNLIVTNQQLSDSLDPEMRHYIHQHTYAYLLHHPAVVTLGVADDTVYQDYVSANVPAQSKLQVEAADLMAERDAVAAQTKIDQYETVTLYNGTLKTVQTIWNQWLLTGDTITVADSLTLYDIACSDPLLYGTGVYVARNILDWDGECPEAAQITISQPEKPTETQKTAIVSIAPNPNNGSFNLLSDKELVQLSVLNLNGQLIWESSDQTEHIQLDLKPGIYLLKSVNSDNEVVTTRFAVE